MLDEKTMAAIAILNVPNILELFDTKISGDNVPVEKSDLYQELLRTELGVVIDLYLKYGKYLNGEQRDAFRIYLKEMLNIENNLNHELVAIILATNDSSWLQYLFEHNRFEACFTFFAIIDAKDINGIARAIEMDLANIPLAKIDPKHVFNLIVKYEAYLNGLAIKEIV